MAFKDPERRREYRRQWYVKNKDSEKEHVQRRKRQLRAWFLAHKKSLRCSQCSESHPATLEFHHRLREEKERGIAKMIDDGMSINKILEEMRKCQVVCANCHRKIHYKESSKV